MRGCAPPEHLFFLVGYGFALEIIQLIKSSFLELVLSISGANAKEVIESSFLGLVFSTSGAKARKLSNRVSWDWFCRLLEPRLENQKIELPGTRFVDFWSQGQKVIKSILLGLVLLIPRANARKL